MNLENKEGLIKEAMKQLQEMSEEDIKQLLIKTIVKSANDGFLNVSKEHMDKLVKHIDGLSKDEILNKNDIEKFDFDDLMKRCKDE